MFMVPIATSRPEMGLHGDLLAKVVPDNVQGLLSEVEWVLHALQSVAEVRAVVPQGDGLPGGPAFHEELPGGAMHLPCVAMMSRPWALLRVLSHREVSEEDTLMHEAVEGELALLIVLKPSAVVLSHTGA